MAHAAALFARHQPVLLDLLGGLLGQLHPATRVCSRGGSRLHARGADVHDLAEARQPEVPRLQPFGRQEPFNGGRFSDDGQPVAVTDQFDLVVQRRLLRCVESQRLIDANGCRL